MVLPPNRMAEYKCNYFVPSILLSSYIIHSSIRSGGGEMKQLLSLSDREDGLWFFVPGADFLICDNEQ
jgi:hypothetical protein